ncbi:unnamed protein product [Zymoseptoria tritici ST99CH_1A5]|uniref:Uncharacterized protein n=2 Tax=Zymoseptoria tritici TaxID=1047171 RepID=A0A2H1GPN2_ZYMTR|nr:unnamed protein product [Zymoseptoria tritici ST99CH_1E4]SMR57885.1 unnamed protein product [Zymoseptoria tritici ST99CH_3D1]SMY26320.1 unnamed protein product [Zymoseptoria tritici ST99CH_1A5]
MHFYLLTASSVLFSSSLACSCWCVCLDANGQHQCFVEVAGIAQYAREGYCHDRNCGGMIVDVPFKGEKYRVRKGWCDLKKHYIDDIGLSDCNLINNKCQKDFDCWMVNGCCNCGRAGWARPSALFGGV